MRQLSSPTEACENRLSSGGVSLTRVALVMPRSGSNYGFSRAPLVGLRVVATSSVGLAERSDASNRAPPSTRLAQPASAAAHAPDVPARSTPRRDMSVLRSVRIFTRTRCLGDAPVPRRIGVPDGAATWATLRGEAAILFARSRQDQPTLFKSQHSRRARRLFRKSCRWPSLPHRLLCRPRRRGDHFDAHPLAPHQRSNKFWDGHLEPPGAESLGYRSSVVEDDSGLEV